MDVEVYYGGQRGGTMPYTVLPAFRLFCKQNGFQIKWDAKNKRIDLDSGLKGKICVLAPGGTAGETSYEGEILGKVHRFLSDFGIEVVLVEKKSDIPKDRDVAIRLSAKELRTAVKPKLELFQSEDEKRKSLINSLHAELKHTGITCVLKAQKEIRSVHSFLAIQLQLPKDTDASRRKAYGEKIAFYLASGILRYFQAAQQILPISYLPPHILKEFFGSVLTDQAGTLQLGHKDEQEQEQEQVLELEQEHHQSEQTEPGNEDQEGPLEETALLDEEKQTPAEKRLEAEVFFDYTLFHSDVEHRPFLLMGNLYVKNTGTEDLINPIVCLRVSPVDSIKLGGQILPPNLVETMGVQSSSGIKGWRYLEDDWFSQAQERGEYWIAPIQPISISPKATEPFQNFQISIKKPETGNIVTVEGVVLFNDQEIHFPANNRIAISF